MALQKCQIKKQVFLSGALIMSGIGDIFLTLTSKISFLSGLCCFFSAHMLLIITFFGYLEKPLFFSFFQKNIILILILGAVIMGGILTPYLPQFLKWPTYLYICVLSLMIMTAISIRPFPSIVFLGALFFGISDTMLGISTFITPFSGQDYLIWFSYYIGQILIVFGILNLNQICSIHLQKN